MALSLMVGEAGFTTSTIQTGATVHLIQIEEGYEINEIHLAVSARVPRMGEKEFFD